MSLIVGLEDGKRLKGQLGQEAYNALDTTGTLEIANVLKKRLDGPSQTFYRFEFALQAPALAMMRRGVLVDQPKRAAALREVEKELAAKVKEIAAMELVTSKWDGREKVTGICSVDGKRHKWPRGIDDDDPARVCEKCGSGRWTPKPFEPGSAHQTKHLFYDLHGLPEQYNKDKRVSVDDDILERIGRKWPRFLPLTEALRAVRDLTKQAGWLGAKLDKRGRFPSSFNVGAAWTGRFSSSKNPYGLGGNLQNVSERHRKVFIPDPGREILYADLKQAESLAVAYLAEDEKYIEAHKSGDTHTYVTRLLWPDMPWTGDLKKDKDIAKTLPEWDPVEGHDFRFQAKRIQHGSNYGLTPRGIAMIAHIPVKVADHAQGRFFDAFPGIRGWQMGVLERVRNSLPIINALGRRLKLYGRPWDDHTYKQGLAAGPQSLVADVLDLAMYRIWEKHDPWLIELLAQVHDAVLGQSGLEKRQEVIEAIVEAMTIPIPMPGGRTMVIPVEIAMGGNWGHKSKDNPNGIEEVY